VTERVRVARAARPAASCRARSETYLRADPNKWALALCSTTGQQLLLGDYNERFCVDSCGKLVPYLIALELLGAAEVHKYVGKEPNGRNFNDLALDKNNRPHSPVLNAGAMMVAALIKPDEPMAARFAYVRGVWERLVGGTAVGFDNEAYLARLDKGMRCWTLAYMMYDSNAFPPHVKRGTPLNETVELFFMLTSLTVHGAAAGDRVGDARQRRRQPAHRRARVRARARAELPLADGELRPVRQ
jgi:glutaminase